MSKKIFFLIILGAIIRLFPLGFPAFTTEEAKIAFRGYVIATTGKDELGRGLPILFNSLTDYMMPVTSYITAVGELFFGKSDFGARIPFYILGISLVFLIYKIAQVLSTKKEFWLSSSVVAAFSPGLIFFSKFPNEIIISANAFCLLFLLIKRGANLLMIAATFIIILLTSKTNWWILLPFTIFTLWIYSSLAKKFKIVILLCLLLFITVSFYWQVPQAKRSLLENDSRIFQDITVKNAVEKLRSQGIESGWPNFTERILFNKLFLILAGILHWLSHLAPATLFGQFDSSGTYGLIGMGAFPKIAIIPLIVGLIYIIRLNQIWLKATVGYILILTFPLIFLYPYEQKNIIILALPFISLIIAWGLSQFRAIYKYAIYILITFEVVINFTFVESYAKNTNETRPVWIRSIVKEGYSLSLNDNVAISDDVITGVSSYLQWYTPIDIRSGFTEERFPYKYHQSQIANIRIIGADNTFYNCSLDKPTFIFASKRDLAEIQHWLNIRQDKITKIYKDTKGNETVYLLKPTICVH